MITRNDRISGRFAPGDTIHITYVVRAHAHDLRARARAHTRARAHVRAHILRVRTRTRKKAIQWGFTIVRRDDLIG